MQDDLHEQIWLSYRRTMLDDWSGNPAEAFRAALDVYLGTHRHATPAAACSAVAYMIAMRPRSVGCRSKDADARPAARGFGGDLLRMNRVRKNHSAAARGYLPATPRQDLAR